MYVQLERQGVANRKEPTTRVIKPKSIGHGERTAPDWYTHICTILRLEPEATDHDHDHCD